MILALLDGPCFGYEYSYYSYKVTSASVIIFVLLIVMAFPIINVLNKALINRFENSGKDNLQLPGRDSLQLETAYSHPNEVFVPFSTNLSESLLVKALVILVCIALIFLPLQLAL